MAIDSFLFVLELFFNVIHMHTYWQGNLLSSNIDSKIIYNNIIWDDAWVVATPLYCCFEDFYLQAMHPNLSVASFWNSNTFEISVFCWWAFWWHKRLFSFNDCLIFFFQRYWIISGMYQLGSWYMMMCSLSTLSIGFSFLEGLKIPISKCYSENTKPKKDGSPFFGWQTRTSYTDEILTRKGRNMISGYCFWGTNLESINHLFFHF